MSRQHLSVGWQSNLLHAAVFTAPVLTAWASRVCGSVQGTSAAVAAVPNPGVGHRGLAGSLAAAAGSTAGGRGVLVAVAGHLD